MTTVVKNVDLADLPEDWRAGLGDAKRVRVTLESVVENTEERKARLRALIDSIKPSKPKDGLPDSVSTLRELRDNPVSRTLR